MTQFQLKLVELVDNTATFYTRMDILVDETTTQLVVKMPLEVVKVSLHSRYHAFDTARCFSNQECHSYWRPKNIQDAIKWVKKNISKPCSNYYKKILEDMKKHENVWFLEVWV